MLHAGAGAFTYARRRAKRRMWVPSRLFGYWNGREIEGNVAADTGLTMRTGLLTIRKFGLPPESYWSYDDTPAGPDGAWKPGDRPRRKPSAEAYTVAERYQGLTAAYVRQDLTHLRGMLCEGWPMAFGTMLYSSLYDPATGRPRSIVPRPAPSLGDYELGGHAILLCGHNDGPGPMDLGDGHVLPAEHFLIRNSWGTGEQMGGYFAMPYSYVTDPALSGDFWMLSEIER